MDNWTEVLSTKPEKFGPFSRVAFLVENSQDWKKYCQSRLFSCFMCSKIGILEKIYGRPITRILDVFYGQGELYYHCPNYHITAVDIEKWDWLVQPTEFYQQDALQYMREASRQGKRWDLVVLDPPYTVRPYDQLEEEKVRVWQNNVEEWTVDKIITAVKLGLAVGNHVFLKIRPKDWVELGKLLTLGPAHLFIYRVGQTAVLKNVKYHKNATFLLHYTREKT